MTHPLTPREKVQPFERYPALASWIAKMASVGNGLSLGEWMTFVGTLHSAIVQAEQRTALASGSGDHAELARLAEASRALELAAIRFDEIYEAAEVNDVAYRNEATIHGINGIADVAQAEIRTFLSKEAEQ